MTQVIGSFWSSVFKDKEKVRVLLETNLRTQLLGAFNQAVQNFAGNAELGALVRHTFVPFEQNDVIETGMQVYDDHAFNYGVFTDAATVFGDYRIRYWALPLQDVLPVAIQAKDRQLLLGLDFFIQANRYVYFRQDPREIFPPGKYLVVRGYQRDYRSYVSYFTQTHAPGNDDLVVNYFRGMQTPQYFKLALAAVGGLGIIRSGGKLLSKVQPDPSLREVVYVFEDEAVKVGYEHTALEIGKVYEPLTVIGDVIQVLQADRKETAWWRQLDWRGGLLLDPLIPGVRSLPLPDVWVPAYNAGEDAGSVDGDKAHVQLRLSQDFYAEKLYWDTVRAAETRTGYYLNNVVNLPAEIPGTYDQLLAVTAAANALNFQLGLSQEQPDVASLPGAKPVNALDVFFQAVLGDVGMVVAFNQKQLARQKEVFDFLSREMPIGGCPIIIGFVPDVIDDYDTFGDTILVEETVNMSADLLVQLVEDVDGLFFEGESVSIISQAPTV